MKITNTKIILVAVVLLAILACAFVVWKLHSNAPATRPPGVYAQYVIKDGKVYWDEYMQVQWDDNKIHDQVNEWEMKEADAKTFTAIGGDWGKDAKNVFYQGMRAVSASPTPTADVRTLAAVPESYFIKDARAVYFPVYSSRIEGWAYTVFAGADPATFEKFKDVPYAKDKNHVYFLDIYDDNQPIAGLDPATFRVIGECGWGETYHYYAVADSRSVYAVDKIVPGADPATFQIVGLVDNNPGGLSSGTGYAKDKNHAYKGCTKIVPGVNPAQCTAENLKGCEAQ